MVVCRYAQTRLLQAAEELHFATFCQDWCQTFMITDSRKSPVKAWSLPGSGLMIQNYRLRRVHIVTVSKQSKHPQNTHFIERTSYNACPQPAHSSWDSSIKNVKFSVYGQFGGKRLAGPQAAMLRTDHAGFCEFCLRWMWILTKQFNWSWWGCFQEYSMLE